MKFEGLERNIADIIAEQQIKLGYRSETVRLYYPLISLNRFLGREYTIDQMHEILSEFCKAVEPRLGKIKISNEKERFCFAIPPEGNAYIHDHMGDGGFIKDFIKAIEKHGCTIDDLVKIFRQYADHVHVEKINQGDFDYLVYFEDGIPDNFRYCITDEGCHMIYHRFTQEDYRDFELE